MENQTNFNQIIVGYRDRNINPESPSGNFFHLVKSNALTFEYNLTIDNLLSIPDEDIKNKKLPSESIAKKWFKKYNLKEIAAEKNIPYDVFINRLVAKEASKRGYDAIKYGDFILQGVKMDKSDKEVIDEEGKEVSAYLLQKIKKKLLNTETKLSPTEFEIAFKKYPDIVDRFVKTKLDDNIWMSMSEKKYAKEKFPKEDVIKYDIKNNLLKMEEIVDQYPEIVKEKLKSVMDIPNHIMTEQNFSLIVKLFPPEQVNTYIETQLPRIQVLPGNVMEYAFVNFMDKIREYVVELIQQDGKILSPIFLNKLNKYDPDLAKKYINKNTKIDKTINESMNDGLKILRDYRNSIK